MRAQDSAFLQVLDAQRLPGWQSRSDEHMDPSGSTAAGSLQKPLLVMVSHLQIKPGQHTPPPVQRPHSALVVPAAAALTAAELVLGQPLRGFGLQAYCRFHRPLVLASWQVLSPQQGSDCPGLGKLQESHCCTHTPGAGGVGDGLGAGAGLHTSPHCAPCVHLAIPAVADLQAASEVCEHVLLQHAPSGERAWQKLQELSARQMPLQPLLGTFCVQTPAAQQLPCCAGVALQEEAAQLRVVEKLPRHNAAVVSLHAPILGLQQAPSTSTVGEARLFVVMLSLSAVTTAGTVWLPVVTALTLALKLRDSPAFIALILQT